MLGEDEGTWGVRSRIGRSKAGTNPRLPTSHGRWRLNALGLGAVLRRRGQPRARLWRGCRQEGRHIAKPGGEHRAAVPGGRSGPSRGRHPRTSSGRVASGRLPLTGGQEENPTLIIEYARAGAGNQPRVDISRHLTTDPPESRVAVGRTEPVRIHGQPGIISRGSPSTPGSTPEIVAWQERADVVLTVVAFGLGRADAVHVAEGLDYDPGTPGPSASTTPPAAWPTIPSSEAGPSPTTGSNSTTSSRSSPLGHPRALGVDMNVMRCVADSAIESFNRPVEAHSQ